MSIDSEIIKEFVDESKTLVDDLVAILESIEGDFTKKSQLADYGNGVDRIMGGAKSLALLAPPDHALHMISDYAAVCKAVSYKASQINNNQQFFDICVGLLLDATENLAKLLTNIDKNADALKQNIPQAFIERLHWASDQFAVHVRATVTAGATAKKTSGQEEINDLIKKLGL